MGGSSILPVSRSCAAVATVFGGPGLAPEPAKRVRRSHCSAPPDRFVSRPCSSFVKTVFCDDRSPWLRSPGATSVALLPRHQGRRVRGDTASNMSSVRDCRHWPRPPRTTIAQWKVSATADKRTHVWSGRGRGRSASDGRDCAAPVPAHCPLKTMAVKPRLLPFRKSKGISIDGGGHPILDL